MNFSAPNRIDEVRAKYASMLRKLANDIESGAVYVDNLQISNQTIYDATAYEIEKTEYVINTLKVGEKSNG